MAIPTARQSTRCRPVDAAVPASFWVTGTNRVRCCAWMPAAGRWIPWRAADGPQVANQGWHLPEQVHAPG
ncbi:hypothetical protein G6F35_010369 [Rhizopus arrhizus]|nr:hypothetical protein G6F35_010369 [Rhizopus arrhizus]KAG1221850.1 hypothetical protein G6F68_020809 [Rhizopus microsporus]